jgi:hypothetical protein
MGGTAVGTMIVHALVGQPTALPADLVARFPELGGVRWRRGGLPPRIGGWCLGRASVAAITLGRTVFLAPGARLDPLLLLHEHRHVTQFQQSLAFPLLYVLESLRHGYYRNRFEVDARDYAAARIQAPEPLP